MDQVLVTRGLTLIRWLCVLAVVMSGAIATPSRAQDDSELVQLIQQLLIDRGYPIGQNDGVAGRRTRAAISAFEQSLGRAPTGEPSQELYELLLGSIEDNPSPGSPFSVRLEDGPLETVETGTSRPTSLPRAEKAGSLVGTQWRVIDSTGASFQVTLERDGRISGTAFDRFWRWRRFGASLQLRFDNEFGDTVTREGELVDNRSISGVAQSSDGQFWDWSAVLQNRP